MFVVLVNYLKSLAEVDAHLEAHRKFLDIHYKAGHLICSGSQIPRTGGVILATSKDRASLEVLLAQDPFKIHGIAEYTLVEFNPTKSQTGFEGLIGK